MTGGARRASAKRWPRCGIKTYHQTNAVAFACNGRGDSRHDISKRIAVRTMRRQHFSANGLEAIGGEKRVFGRYSFCSYKYRAAYYLFSSTKTYLPVRSWRNIKSAAIACRRQRISSPSSPKMYRGIISASIMSVGGGGANAARRRCARTISRTGVYVDGRKNDYVMQPAAGDVWRQAYEEK